MKARFSAPNWKAIAKRIASVEDKVQRKAQRDALGTYAKTVSQQLKSSVPVDGGALRKSIGWKVKVQRIKRTMVAVIGARKVSLGKKAEVRARRKAEIAARLASGKITPTRYIHLVEKKHRMRQGGESKGSGVVASVKRRTDGLFNQLVTQVIKGSV